MNPPAIPAQIHDIVDVVPIFPYPITTIAPAAAVLILLLGWLVWFFLLRRTPPIPPTPQEIAIAALVRLQGTKLDSPYEFAVAISDILRNYLDHAFGLRATTATSIEFLESIRDNRRFSQEEKAALAHFLGLADLLKFARIDAGGEELKALFDAAERIIRKEAGAEATPAPPPIPAS